MPTSTASRGVRASVRSTSGCPTFETVEVRKRDQLAHDGEPLATVAPRFTDVLHDPTQRTRSGRTAHEGGTRAPSPDRLPDGGPGEAVSEVAGIAPGEIDETRPATIAGSAGRSASSRSSTASATGSTPIAAKSAVPRSIQYRTRSGPSSAEAVGRKTTALRRPRADRRRRRPSRRETHRFPPTPPAPLLRRRPVMGLNGSASVLR